MSQFQQQPVSRHKFQWQGKPVLSQFQQPGRTSFELVTTSFNHKEKWFELVTASFNQQWEPGRTSLFVCVMQQQPVSTTSQNQFELVSTTRKNQFWASHNQFQSQGKMVWASYSQFQPAVRTRKNQFVCLCHAQQPVSTTSHNQFELVSTTRKNQFWASHNQFQSQGKMVWASYSQFQQAVRTRKNQFELVTASSITRKNRSEPVFWGTCLFVSCTTASFNNQEEPVWASHSQFKWQEKTSLS